MCRIEGIQLYILDMEWAGKKGRIQPLEIGVVPVDTDIEPFFSRIRPEDPDSIKAGIFSLLKTQKKVFKSAPSFPEVIRRLDQYRISGSYEKTVAIVWHMDSADIFSEACKKHKVKNPFDRIVSLKDLMKGEVRKNGRESGFEEYLKAYHVYHDRRKFHNSKYDVECLKHLFREFRKKAGEFQSDTMIMVNKHSGIIHRADCHHVSRDGRGFRAFIMEDIYLSGRLCRDCCRDQAPWIRPLSDEDRKMIELEGRVRKYGNSEQFKDTSIAAVCAFFGLDYETKGNCIEVVTACGRWRLYHNGNCVTKVFHGNHEGRVANGGYHEERILQGRLFGVLKYITDHDKAIESGKLKTVYKGKNRVNQCQGMKVKNHVKSNYYIEKDEWEEYYD